MIFKWFDTTEVDALAMRVVQEFVEHLPRSTFEATSNKADAKRRKNHDLLLQQVRDFATARRLNIYQKSRLANRVKWALAEAGYPKSFVDEIAYELAAVTALAGKSKT